MNRQDFSDRDKRTFQKEKNIDQMFVQVRKFVIQIQNNPGITCKIKISLCKNKADETAKFVTI